MEQEHFVSGYCRQLDGSRMVTVVTQNGQIVEVDCAFGACPYETSCPIAKQIENLK